MTQSNTLIELLEKLSETMLSKKEAISPFVHYESWQEFGKHLQKQVEELKQGKKVALHELKMIFLPTSDWDDSGGIEGYNPDQILKLIENYKI